MPCSDHIPYGLMGMMAGGTVCCDEDFHPYAGERVVTDPAIKASNSPARNAIRRQAQKTRAGRIC